MDFVSTSTAPIGVPSSQAGSWLDFINGAVRGIVTIVRHPDGMGQNTGVNGSGLPGQAATAGGGLTGLILLVAVIWLVHEL